MTALLVGLLVCVGVAVTVIVLVALPHLREGSPILTPEGERLAEEARRRASATAGVLKEKVTAVVVGVDEPAGPPAPAAAEAARTPQGAPSGEQPGQPSWQQSGPPRQVVSAAATPAPGTPLVVEDRTQEQLDRLTADQRG